jgi:hypothetical protein
MALNKNLSANYLGKNITLNGAYIKISRVEGTKDNVLLVVSAQTQKDGELIWEKGFAFDPLSQEANVFASGYAHIKTLPEFAGAVDC